MYFACKCDPSVPLKPLLDQLEKQNIVFQLIEDNEQPEIWLEDSNLIKPVADFYVQYLDRYQNRLSIKNLKTTPVTTFLLLITFIAALMTQLGSQHIDVFLIAKMQYYPRDWFFYDGLINLWRFVSPIFLHFGVEHLIFNTLSFWYLGSILEKNIGKVGFLLFVLVTATISNLAQLLISGPLFGGLSGVVYGLIGFTFLYQKWIRNLNIPNGLLYFSIAWMALGLTDLLAVIGLGNMANTAHLSGLLVGFLLFIVYRICILLFIKKGRSYEP